MTDLIEQLRKLEGKTTEGPWSCESDGKTWWVDTGGKQVCEVCASEQDATLISLAPSMAKKLLAAEAVVRAMHDLSEWQSYDSARAVFDPPMPEKYECTDDAKEALVSALDAYEAL